MEDPKQTSSRPRTWRDPFIAEGPSDPAVEELIRSRNNGSEVTQEMIDDAAQAAELAREVGEQKTPRRLASRLLQLKKQ